MYAAAAPSFGGYGYGRSSLVGFRPHAPIVRVPIHCYACERHVAISGIFDDIGDWLGDAASCCGRILEAGGKLISEIPIIGDIFTAAFHLVVAPFQMALAIARGANIGDAIIDAAKSAVAAVHELAPYIQAVLSVVPGIGTGLSAVISGGLALASGMPIDQVLIEAVKGAIPGGPLAQAAFIVASSTISAAAHGEDIGSALERGAVQGGMQLMKFTPNVLESLSTAGKDLSDGASNAAMSALDTVTKAVPPEAMKGLELAISFGAGASIQKKTLDQVKSFGDDQVSGLVTGGYASMKSSAVLSSAMGTATGSNVDQISQAILSVYQSPDFLHQWQAMAQRFGMSTDLMGAYLKDQPQTVRDATSKGLGYLQAIGLQSCFDVNEDIIGVVRGKLPTDLHRQGFDYATTTRIGAVKGAPLTAAAAVKIAAAQLPGATTSVFVSKNTAVALSQAAAKAAAQTASVQAGYYTAIGLSKAAQFQRQAIAPLLVSDPAMKLGAMTAAQIVDQQLSGNPWDILTHVRAIVARLAAGDAGTVSAIAAVRAQAAQGDGRAKKLLLMIDIVTRLESEEAAALSHVKALRLDRFELLWQKILSVPRSLTRGL
jgi:hypothetical protein